MANIKGSDETKNAENLHILDIVSVIVLKKTFDYNLIIGQSVSVPCNAQILSSVFNGLIKKWYHNKNLIKEKSFDKNRDFELIASDYLILEDLNLNHSGLYECKVYDPKTGRIWKTSKVKVKVGNAEFTELMRNKIFWSFVAGFVFLYTFIIVIILYFNYKQSIKKIQNLKEKN